MALLEYLRNSNCILHHYLSHDTMQLHTRPEVNSRLQLLLFLKFDLSFLFFSLSLCSICFVHDHGDFSDHVCVDCAEITALSFYLFRGREKLFPFLKLLDFNLIPVHLDDIREMKLALYILKYFFLVLLFITHPHHLIKLCILQFL